MINLTTKIDKLEDELVQIRREFHSFPETAFEEYKTSQKIAEYLKQCGLEVETGIAETGVVGLLKGGQPGKTIAIRVDIDALPVKEETNLEFASKNKGKMHACGHDGHITLGLGTAKILSQVKERIKGNVKFIFQPAEEELSGAQPMIEEGVLDNPEVDAIIGCHIWPELESGYVGVKQGPMMAAVDKFEIEITGKGGHGAIPNKAVDPVVMTSEAVTALQKIISREISPLKSGVITVGTFNAGTTFNVIPDNVELSGTVRTFDPQIRNFIPQRMEEIIAGITEGDRGDYKFDFTFKIPATINDNQFTTEVKKIIKDVLGTNKLIESIQPSMGGEDFSLYQQEIPGTYIFLGTKNEKKGLTQSIHYPKYSIDEDILPLGVKIFCEIALRYLNK